MTLDELSGLLSQAEFHKTLKVEAVALEADGALTLKLPFDEGYTLFKKVGAYHGGVIASLIDVAGTMVCSAVKGRPTPTVDLRVDYLKSPVRCDLYADAVPRRIGRGIGVADVTVRGEDGTVYAIGRGAFSTADG
ncbi:PaaI family thioesterase [Amorphus sp. 3PC139-8]|uniref:PaaI family thioesterase n=1 Tax=Amorphus sp. 3PC139-8 TaxID=2735676 RepID=UPI00345C90B6